MNRIEQLSKEIMSEIRSCTKDPEIYIKACLRSVQGEAKLAERQRIAEKLKDIGDDIYNKIMDM